MVEQIGNKWKTVLTAVILLGFLSIGIPSIEYLKLLYQKNINGEQSFYPKNLELKQAAIGENLSEIELQSFLSRDTQIPAVNEVLDY